MSIYSDDWGDGPEVVSRADQERSGLIRRNDNTRYVPAVPVSNVRRVEVPAQPQQIIVVPHQVQSDHAIRENTTPVQRAIATVISSAFWGLLIVPLGLLFIWLTDADPGAIVLSIAGIVLAVGYIFLRFDRQAHDHSPAGVAIHDRELTHTERMHELDLRYKTHNRMIDHLTGQEVDRD